MPSIFQNDFNLGWRPSDDSVNGPKNCLLRMQNVKLDENGALTLIPGSSKIGAIFANEPAYIFSKVVNGTLYRFAYDTAGALWANSGAGWTNIASGPAGVAAFSSAYSEVLFAFPAFIGKYAPGVVPLTSPLGFGIPPDPAVVPNNPYTKDITGTIGSYTALVGTVTTSGSYVKIVQDSTILSGVASLVYGSPQDSTNLSGGSVGLPTDIFNIEVKIDDPTQVQKIFILFKDTTDNKSYFSYELVVRPSDTRVPTGRPRPVNPGLNIPPGQAVKLQAVRGDFEVVGRPQWSNIGEVIVGVDVLNTPTNFYFDNLIFSGGTLGSLTGDLEYRLITINTSFPYTSRSFAGNIVKVHCENTSVQITPNATTFATMPAANSGLQLYRRGGGLDKFYLVYTRNSNSVAAFSDTVTDQTALLTGIILDENVQTIGALTDPMKAIVGPFFNRWIYFSATSIYISQDGNPELFNIGTGYLTPYGTSGELFLWAEKFGNSAILVGTTNDIYELTGTFSELPDGTIDLVIRPTGCKNPPINDAHAATANELYYVSSDGIRQVNPSGNQPFWFELDLLFKGKTRYGMIPPKVNGGNVDKFVLAISHNELYFSFVDTNGLRKMFTYDLLRKYSYEFKSDDGGYSAPTCLFTEESGNLIAGFSDAPNRYVRILNTGTLIDGASNPVIYLRTKVFNGDTPRQRKDSYTLKLKINTGGSGIEIRLYKDESSSYVSLGFISSSVSTEKFIDLSSVIGLCKSYQLEIAGNCPEFKLEDFSIDYDLRPVPLSYFRSQPTNFGIQGRKRIYEIPIIIDTLSSAVTMTPVIDGVNQTPVSISTAGKTTYNYVFNPPTAGKDVYFTLLETGGNGFEFYGEVQPRVIEPIPDAVTSFIIPYTNLETYARKRIIAFAFVIDTNGNNCTFTPKIDGVNYPAKTINTLDKRTFVYYFDSATIGTDIGGLITSNSTNTFEYYGISLSECISEKLPPSATVYVIHSTNLGTYARKRFIAFAFVIDTHGNNCSFTPSIDGIAQAARIFSTNGKRTYVYYFDVRTEGIDISGVLSSPGLTSFEFYSVSLDECVSEKLPPSCTYLVIPPNNLGSASKKRIRTIPLVIDTRGSDVVYTPTVDGVSYPLTTFNTSEKRTVLYYFTQDAFGIDVSGILDGTNNFEFYGVQTPENVEVIPVGKLFDQLGPIEFLRNANIKAFRVRMIATGTSITYNIYVDDVLRETNSITTLPNIDKTYEIPWTKKYLNGTTCRIELSSTSVFHRISSELRVNETGSQTNGKWRKI